MKMQKIMLSVGLFILRLAIVILVIVGIYKLGEISYTYTYSIIADAAVDKAPGKDVRVTVESDMDASDVAELLEKKGLVSDSVIFRLQLKVNDYEDKLKPGSYVLNTSMRPKEMMRMMAGETMEE